MDEVEELRKLVEDDSDDEDALIILQLFQQQSNRPLKVKRAPRGFYRPIPKNHQWYMTVVPNMDINRKKASRN